MFYYLVHGVALLCIATMSAIYVQDFFEKLMLSGDHSRGHRMLFCKNEKAYQQWQAARAAVRDWQAEHPWASSDHPELQELLLIQLGAYMYHLDQNQALASRDVLDGLAREIEYR